MINFYCPGFVEGIDAYIELIKLQKEYPYLFNPDVNIKKIFGCFPNMIWNGGGFCFGDIILPRQAEEIVQKYTDLNIPLQLTCTNPMLQPTDVYDRYCNFIMSIFDNGLNEILVSSPYLEDYIRSKYPNYKIDKSIIASEEEYNYEEALEYYNTVVLPRRHGKNFDFLKTIKDKNKDRIEILCNDPCPENCPRLYEHYKQFGKVTLYEIEPEDKRAYCIMNFKEQPDWIRNKEDMILIDEIYEKYLPLGFTEFKLSGRSSYKNILTSIIPYLIKKEYQFEVFAYFF